MGTFWQDIRYAFRGFQKSPGFFLAAIFALAVGVGANTTIFSVVNAVLLNSRPLRAMESPDRLVMLWETTPLVSSFIGTRLPPCLQNYLAWKQQSHSFEDMAFYTELKLNLTSATDVAGRKPEQVSAARGSANFFPLLGVRPAIGRNFTAQEMQPGSAKIAILSDELYRSRFQGDPKVLGQTVRADAVEYQIVGVLPAGFELPAMWQGFDQKKPRLWLPANISPDMANAQQRIYFVYGRLKPGVTVEQTRAEMNVIAKRLQRADPQLNTSFGVHVFSVSEEDVDPKLRRSLLVLQVAVAFVLLIACANVANLLLTRAVGREREIAVRIALGAARIRILRQMLSESLLLSLLGGLAGLLLSFGGIRLIAAFAPQETHGFHELRLDPGVLLFTVLVTTGAGVLFGLAPAFHALRQSVNEVLARGGRSIGARSNGLRSALVVTEIALSLVLLIGAGLMIRSLSVLMATDMGFRPGHVLSLTVSLPEAKYGKPGAVVAFDNQLLDKVRAVPGVLSASLTDSLPMKSINESSYQLEGVPARSGAQLVAETAHVREDYFETLGSKLVGGRTFRRQDMLAPGSVALVNQSFGRINWPNQNAIGKAVVFPQGNGKPLRYEIVGIVADEHQLGPDSPGHPELYMPGPELHSMILIVRTARDPLALSSAIESAVWSIDKEQPVAEVESMDHMLHQWTAPRRFNMTVLLNFAGAALLLAAIGLYSVLAYSVSLRTREIGVRAALGAEPRGIALLVVRQGFRLIALGIAVGLAAAFALVHFLQSLIFGISATDPGTFGLVVSILAAVSLLASYVPARRAARIDPIQALRVE